MGGCATKPRDLAAAEGEAPAPEEKQSQLPAPALAPEEEGSAEAEENRRRSLGILFKENEESAAPAAETEKNVIEESMTPPQVETKEAVETNTEEQAIEEPKPEAEEADASKSVPGVVSEATVKEERLLLGSDQSAEAVHTVKEEAEAGAGAGAGAAAPEKPVEA